jgi:1-acyl-sn-glycerol-3-phosphate acyltransferase
VARRKLGFWGRFAATVVIPATNILNKPDWRGREHFPATGPVIVVVNHMSDADPFVIARFVYEAGRWPQFLAKESLFHLPLAGKILTWCRQIPVRRGTTDAVRSLDFAVEAIEKDGTVVIYPEGTITKDHDLWPMRGKTGAARLHMLTGAPVIPVAMWGVQDLYNRYRPKKLKLRTHVPVSVWAGPPVDLSEWADAEPTATVLNDMTEAIMLRIRDMLGEIRDETPPPLWTPAVRKESSE